MQVKEHLYDIQATTKAVSYIYGLGGRDYTVDSAKGVFAPVSYTHLQFI